MTPDTKTALVIGATGGIGGQMAKVLSERGWRIKALNRRPDEAARRSVPLAGLAWVAGDAMNARDVVEAAKGADLIVHGANPPAYRKWGELVLPMLESSIAAARASGARILFPGTVYNFGPDVYGSAASGVARETTPQSPTTRKGAIRVEMERRLEASGVRVLIVRAGDFFGPGVTGNSWFTQMVRPGRPVRSIVYPGDPEVGHAWAFLPDLAETMMRLVERGGELADFSVFHFGGHWFERGGDLALAIRRVAEAPKAPIRRFPWPLVAVLSPVTPLFRELREMRYLWRRPLRLQNQKLRAFLGEEPQTPLDHAVALALESLGCRSPDGSAAARAEPVGEASGAPSRRAPAAWGQNGASPPAPASRAFR